MTCIVKKLCCFCLKDCGFKGNHEIELYIVVTESKSNEKRLLWARSGAESTLDPDMLNMSFS